MLDWARGHCRRSGALPKYDAGPVLDAPGETRAGLDYALRYGRRGLPGGSSLAKLLAGARGEQGQSPGQGGAGSAEMAGAAPGPAGQEGPAS